MALEAMACAVPVIASNFAAPKYYVNEGKNGFKFEKGNEFALQKAILMALDLDEKKYYEMKESALVTAQSYFVENILDILEKTMFA